ncbi:hypothetical protein [Bacillus phage vB_BanS-Thrax5]|nr:hypothetical protein [Bacillus phage vB_BanS-Thrax5]
MKLTALIDKLNTEVTAKFRGVKFDDIGQLHIDIAEVVNEVLEEAKVRLEMRYCWDISLKDEHMKVLKYNIDYTADKRYKWATKGKVHFIVFSPYKEIPDMSEDATVEDLIHGMQLDEAKYHLERMQKDRLEILEQLAVNSEGIEHWKEKIKELESR